MKSLESGKDKMQKICDALRKETLEPAKQEAREIIENAHLQASQIINEAKGKTQELFDQASKEMEQKNKAFHSSLQLASRQGIEKLKQKIEMEVLTSNLSEIIEKETSNVQFIADLIHAFLQIIEKQGIDEDLTVAIPKVLSPRSVNALIASKFLERLKEHSVVLGDFKGGVQIKFHDKKVTIDISDGAIRDLLTEFLRRDFRDLVFQV